MSLLRTSPRNQLDRNNTTMQPRARYPHSFVSVFSAVNCEETLVKNFDDLNNYLGLGKLNGRPLGK